ncbi:MAG: transporter [Candidatus Electronema sp. V4]|uniref:transporter n=1 Tax=Candidatus Electronema sp. V4 TaxID=3454756 RepID=UPI0040553FFF
MIKIISKNKYIFGVSTFWLVNCSIADELHLSNGDRITGQIIELSQIDCTIKTDYQATPLRIKRSEIARLNMIQPDADAIPLNEQLLSVQGKGTEEIIKPIEKKDSSSDILGKEPDEDLRQIFLRESAVLLKPGEKEVDVALSYTRDEYANMRSRQWSIPLSLRFGLTTKLEGTVELPLGWSQREVLAADSVSKNDAAGIGDIGAGLKYIFKQQDKEWPDIIGSFSFNAPTGDGASPIDSNDISVSSGYWQTSTSLNLVKAYDPAVLFGGIGWSHAFKETIDGINLAPGDSFNYSFGMGFSINDQITMSSQLLGVYQTETEMNDAEIIGSSREPMSLQTGFTYRISKGRYLEPAVIFGLNNDASDVALMLSYTHKLDF